VQSLKKLTPVPFEVDDVIFRGFPTKCRESTHLLPLAFLSVFPVLSRPLWNCALCLCPKFI
jgi:hypothetical protein